MKRFFRASLALLALPCAVLPATAKNLPTYNWSGCYLGGHVGGLWGRTKHDLAPSIVPEYLIDVNFSSATAGGHLGCNVQMQQFVFGVEGDLSWAGVNDRKEIASYDQFYATRFDWYSTVRGRAGVAADRWHIYGTAGFAFSDVDFSYSGMPGNFRYTGTSKNGWVAGVGAEYAINPSWTARIEYLHHRFGDGTMISDGGTFRHIAGPQFHVVRIGLSYKFNSKLTESSADRRRP
jgi:outer membrane immunogenic protein